VRIYSPTGLASNADVAPVLDALVKAGNLKPPLPPPSKFFDNTYAAEANKQLR
jgi:hypothetical protein